MTKQHARLGLLTFLVIPLAALGAWSVGHAAPASQVQKGAPVRLHLSVARETTTTDAQGRPHSAWAALAATPGPVRPGDLLRYQVQAENAGAVAVTGLVVTQPVPTGTAFVARSADVSAAGDTQATYSLDGRRFSDQPLQAVAGPDGVVRARPAPPESYTALRWRFSTLASKTTEAVTYQVRVR